MSLIKYIHIPKHFRKNILQTGSSIICNPPFYLRWAKATRIAKQFNLLKKHDRITLFNAILYPES